MPVHIVFKASFVLLCAGSLIASLVAQQPDAPSVSANKRAFDVASIKHEDLNTSTLWRVSPGRVSGTTTTEFLLRRAFPGILTSQQIVGAPNWLGSDRYRISAVLNGPDGPPDQASMQRELPRLLRALLEDRFTLVAHEEQRSVPIYALVLARRDGRLGPQLKAFALGSPPPPGSGSLPPPGTCFKGIVPLDVLVGPLRALSGRIVVNRTGLTGPFDITLQCANGPNADPDLPSLFTALEEQLGLKLESTTDFVKVVVIDHIERPTPD